MLPGTLGALKDGNLEGIENLDDMIEAGSTKIYMKNDKGISKGRLTERSVLIPTGQFCAKLKDDPLRGSAKRANI